MKKIVFAIIAAVLVMALILILPFGCGKTEETVPEVVETPVAEATLEPTPEPTPEPDPVEVMMESMTLDEKIGQLFVITPEALTDAEHPTVNSLSLTDDMKAVYGKYPAAGFILFKQNITGVSQVTSFNESLHALGKEEIRPIICIDEEGGLVARIGNNDAFNVTKFPNMQTIANGGDTGKAYELGNTIGAYLSEYGFDVDFAPVADVNTNPSNPIIGERAFGSDPVLAGEMVCSVLDGFSENGISGCVKHFPGHGDTKTDTHTGYAETTKNWDQIKSCEMLPFIAAIEHGTDFIMVAHIACPEVTGDKTPSSLSYTVITEKLREELGYDGIVITDACNMGAISDSYSSGDAAVKAVNAGVDIVLMPKDYIEAFNAVKAAVESGEISEDRIDESVYRVLSLKMDR